MFERFESKFVDLSTAHIRPEDDAILRDPPPGVTLPVNPIPYTLQSEFGSEQVGWFLRLSLGLHSLIDEEGDDLEHELSYMAACGFSPEFVNLVRLLCEQGYFYLRLDRDAERHPDLPVFEW